MSEITSIREDLQKASTTEQTALSYFGARYAVYPDRGTSVGEAGLSVWLSVDPMSEARPYLSPYNYCQLNPIMLVDPTGMLDESPGDLVGEATSKDGGSVNFYDKFFSLKPGPESLPVHLRPSSGDLNYLPIMIAGNGGDDPPKSKTKEKPKSKESSIVVPWEILVTMPALNGLTELLYAASRASLFSSFLFLSGDSRVIAKQVKPLSDGEIKKLERNGYDVHELKGGKRTGTTDLYKNGDGEILVMPKGGKGPGEPTGINIKDLK
jgi:RHS repeat-associated protein